MKKCTGRRGVALRDDNDDAEWGRRRSAGSGRTDRTGGVQVAAVQQDVRDVEVGLLRSGVAAGVQGWDAQRSDSRTGTCFGYRDKITSVLSALPVNVVRDLVDVTLKLAAWDYDQSVWSISDERHGGADVVGDVEAGT